MKLVSRPEMVNTPKAMKAIFGDRDQTTPSIYVARDKALADSSLAKAEYQMNIIPVKSTEFGGIAWSAIATIISATAGKELLMAGVQHRHGGFYDYTPYLVTIFQLLEAFKAEQTAVGSAA